jgi:hypothetical protein
MTAVARAVVSQTRYMVNRFSAVPTCENRTIVSDLTSTGMEAVSSGRTPNVGGPGYQLAGSPTTGVMSVSTIAPA